MPAFAAARPARIVAAALLGLAACALCGCASVGSLMVDPSRYAGYRCNDLITEWKTLATREQELRHLMEKANGGGGGSIVSAVAYRPDYQKVHEQQKLVQRAAADRKCELVPTYASDQTIR